jgi:hypothetical protein
MCQDIDMNTGEKQQIGVLIKETQAVLHQRMDERLRPLGLSVPQYACLQALADDPGITASCCRDSRSEAWSVGPWILVGDENGPRSSRRKRTCSSAGRRPRWRASPTG